MIVRSIFDRIAAPVIASFVLLASLTQGEEVRSQPSDSDSKSSGILKAYSKIVIKLNERSDIKELKDQLNVAQARYVKALEEVIEKEDPKLLESYRALQAARTQAGPDKALKGFSALSKEERDKLKAARDKAIKQETVQEARKKKDDAKTVEERKIADSAYDEALRAAIIKEDATLVDVLAKFDGKNDKKEP